MRTKVSLPQRDTPASAFPVRALRLAGLVAGLLATRPGLAGVTVDASLNGTASTLKGPNYQVTQPLGLRVGNNLFHSFSQFSVAKGETVTFTGSADIQNVINRVTGGEATTLNGAVKSQVGQANFYFFNPNGVVVGPGGSFSVPAALHVSTASFLKFADGAVWQARTAVNSSLSVATPQAFGFVNAGPLSLTSTGATIRPGVNAPLSLTAGQITIDNTTVKAEGNVQIQAVGSESRDVPINPSAASVAALGPQTGSGDIVLKNKAALTVNGFTAGSNQANAGELVMVSGGDIVLDAGARVTRNSGTVAGGAVTVSAGRDIVLDHASTLVVDTTLFGTAQSFSERFSLLTGRDLNLYGLAGISSTIELGGSAGSSLRMGRDLRIIDGDGIGFYQSGQGSFGRYQISVGRDMTLSNTTDNINGIMLGIKAGSVPTFDINVGGRLSLTSPPKTVPMTWIHMQTHNAGVTGGGTLTISAADIQLKGSAEISAFTGGKVDSPNLVIRTGSLQMDAPSVTGSGQPAVGAYITTQADKGVTVLSSDYFGRAGDLTIETDTLSLQGRTHISAETRTNGDAGTVSITARDWVRLDNPEHRYGIFSSVYINPAHRVPDLLGGLGGKVVIRTPELTLAHAADIWTSTEKTRRAGDIELHVGRLVLGGQGQIASTGIGPGPAGSITIEADQIVMSGQTTVTTNASQGQAGTIGITAPLLSLSDHASITSVSAGAGASGTIDLRTAVLDISGGKVSTTSTGSGAAGSIGITAGQSLRLQRGGSISSDASGGGQAGDVRIDPPLIWIDKGSITTSSTSAAGGDGGNISISGTNMVMRGGFIQANAAADGRAGGRITIDLANLAADGGVVVDDPTRRLALPLQLDAPWSNVVQAASPGGTQGVVNINLTEGLDPQRVLVPKVTLRNPAPVQASSCGQFSRQSSLRMPAQGALLRGLRPSFGVAQAACDQLR